MRIIDIGGRFAYWQRVGLDFLRSHDASVLVINQNLEEAGPNPDPSLLSAEVGDACALNFPDKTFALAHSNSVIEHVGSWDNMIRFASEARRVASNLYVQTPYVWFPVDPHFAKFPGFHWLPRPTRAALLRKFPLAHAGLMHTLDQSLRAVDDATLLDRGQMLHLFPDAPIRFERFLGLPKSMIAETPAIGRSA